MATIDNIIQRAEEVRDETTIGANTAARVGSVMVDTAQFLKTLEGFELQLASDIGQYVVMDGSINSGGTWSSTPPNSLFIRITKGSKIYVTWTETIALFSYSFLSAFSAKDATYAYATGYSGWLSQNGSFTTEDFDAPADAEFFYMGHNYDKIGSIVCDGIEIYSKTNGGRLLGIESAFTQLSLNALRESDLTLKVGTNIANKDEAQDKLVSNTGGISNSTTWKSIAIDVSELIGENLTFGGFHLGRTGYYAFYGNGAKISNGQFSDPQGYVSPYTVTVPSGADTLWFDIQSGSSTTPAGWITPYDELMCCLGTILVSYVPYTVAVSEIKGYPLVGSMSGGGGGGGSIVEDLPISTGGAGIETGYAYIESTTGVVTIKL